MSIRYEETPFGFNWGAAEVSRLFSDTKKGWITFEVKTDKETLQVYVTKTGKIRVNSSDGVEWKREVRKEFMK